MVELVLPLSIVADDKLDQLENNSSLYTFRFLGSALTYSTEHSEACMD